MLLFLCEFPNNALNLKALSVASRRVLGILVVEITSEGSESGMSRRRIFLFFLFRLF
jgi:hypothetical protein